LRHDPPRLPAAYDEVRSLIITPSRPRSTASSMNAVASSASAVTIDGRRNGAGTRSARAARRADSGSSTRASPPACITSKK
jgi:hypothetical protein